MNNTHINYQEYLESYAWKALKKTKLEEQPDCECCGAPATSVHHLSYERLGREKPEDIVSICKRCHEECHHVGGYQIKNDEEILRRRFEEVREENGYSRIKPKIEERIKDDIENADSATLIRLDARFSKDKNYVYEYGRVIENFDVSSFEVINNLYLKDKSHIYYEKRIMALDVSTFKIIENGFLKDKNGIYDSCGKFIKLDDGNCLKHIGRNLCQDINNVYHFAILNWKNIQGVDSGSFQKIGDGYFKDKNFLYKEYDSGGFAKTHIFKHNYNYAGDLLTNVYSPDLNSFEVLNNHYAKDKNYIFFDRCVLVGADPFSFTIIDGGKGGKDRNHEFNEYGITNIFNKISLYADEFFTTPDYKYVYKKITHTWYVVVAGADPKNFSIGFNKKIRDFAKGLFFN